MVSTEPVARSWRLPMWYRIVVQGEITQRSAASLEMSIIESVRDQTVLQVEIIDQAHLYRILNWLYDHGVDLIRLHPATQAT